MKPVDHELNLLNRLISKFPKDAMDFIAPFDVSDSYGADAETVCSSRTQNGYTQSRLGFLNQSRVVRGLPRITLVHRDGEPVHFAVFPTFEGETNA